MTLEFLNLFFAGILAGLELSIHYGVHVPTVALDERPQIVLRQGLVRRLRWLVPAFFVPTALLGSLATVLDGDEPGVAFRGAAILALVVWMVVRFAGTVRINSATLAWNPDAPPKDWREQIGTVEQFHVVGTWSAVLAFGFFLSAVASRIP